MLTGKSIGESWNEILVWQGIGNLTLNFSFFTSLSLSFFNKMRVIISALGLLQRLGIDGWLGAGLQPWTREAIIATLKRRRWRVGADAMLQVSHRQTLPGSIYSAWRCPGAHSLFRRVIPRAESEYEEDENRGRVTSWNSTFQMFRPSFTVLHCKPRTHTTVKNSRTSPRMLLLHSVLYYIFKNSVMEGRAAGLGRWLGCEGRAQAGVAWQQACVWRVWSLHGLSALIWLWSLPWWSHWAPGSWHCPPHGHRPG